VRLHLEIKITKAGDYMPLTQSLNGVWQYRIGKGKFVEKEVPFSELPVGHSEVERYFDLSFDTDKVFLKFDGITYFATVFLNGVKIGEMLPYSEYLFDVTEIVMPKGNFLTVEIEDISPEFGPTEGWGNYGGIIRDVNIVYKNSSYIKDVFFHCDLKDNYKNADYTVEIDAIGENSEFQITLTEKGKIVDQNTSTDSFSNSLESVKLWSPDEPNLYDLTVKMFENGELVDEYTCQVGFREFKCERHRFLLNGRPLFVQGVCRHEMIENSGHTVAEEMIEKDLKMIKETGCNFVRLVHYPHCKKTLEIADKLGLMVSEEPGLWWSETQEKAVADGSLEVLKRTILRDRNHPSIVFWLCFNECKFTEQFLIDSANVCRKYDPTRLVSGANCMSNEDTLKYYNICGFDFYTMHPYSDTFARSLESAKILNDKPLMFTEWGGYFLYDNPHLLRDFINEMYALYKNNSEDGALAGASFWYWGEVYDFGRGKPACVDGVLKEALVDFHRNPTLIYDTYKQAWSDVALEYDLTSEYYYNQISDVKDLTPIKINSEIKVSDLILAFSNKEPEKFNRMRGRQVSVGPILNKTEINGILKKPIFVSNESNIEISVGKNVTTISVLGLTSPMAYPIIGALGEEFGCVTVTYTDGRKSKYPLRNGYEISTVFTTIGSSRINPIAVEAPRFAEFGYEKNFENYVINKFDIKFDGTESIKSINFASLTQNNGFLIYGVFYG